MVEEVGIEPTMNACSARSFSAKLISSVAEPRFALGSSAYEADVVLLHYSAWAGWRHHQVSEEFPQELCPLVLLGSASTSEASLSPTRGARKGASLLRQKFPLLACSVGRLVEHSLF